MAIVMVYIRLLGEGEGRRDGFSSLFKYKKTMPKELFYDFACKLSEYALNREPELFKNTRFWHDLFHALGHLCGWNFKSGRVIGLDSINTEICEQVNSFLQCIKYTGSHLSQEHFVSLFSSSCTFSTKTKLNHFSNRQQLHLPANCESWEIQVCHHSSDTVYWTRIVVLLVMALT